MTNLRVLIVDDERLVADTLVIIAESRGYIARAAYDGEQAAQIADEFKPEACISDVMMPGMNGFELADWMEEHHPQCELLLISGATGTAALLDELALHGKRRTVVTKPMHPTEFLNFLATCHSSARTRS
jgi:DNA-binding response OmpR family regulator